MKAVITIEKTQFANPVNFQSQIESLVKKKETEEGIEYYPKYKKATEVIRILRDAQILYQIRFVQ